MKPTQYSTIRSLLYPGLHLEKLHNLMLFDQWSRIVTWQVHVQPPPLSACCFCSTIYQTHPHLKARSLKKTDLSPLVRVLLNSGLFRELVGCAQQTQGFHPMAQSLFDFLTSSSTTRLYRGWAPRQSVGQFYVLPHMRQSWETMTSVSVGHIILTPTQPVGSGRPQWESNPGPPHQESRAVPTELPPPLPPVVVPLNSALFRELVGCAQQTRGFHPMTQRMHPDRQRIRQIEHLTPVLCLLRRQLAIKPPHIPHRGTSRYIQ